MTEHAELWAELTDAERALITYGGQHGGMVYDGGPYGPECGTLVARGLVGRFEVALTPAGHALAEWVRDRLGTANQQDHSGASGESVSAGAGHGTPPDESGRSGSPTSNL